MTIDNDSEILKKFINGDTSAFDKLFNKYKRIVYWQSRKMLGNHSDADEVTQEVFITIFKKAKDFQFRSSLKTWIYKIVHTKSLNMIRKNKIKHFINFDSNETRKLQNNFSITKNVEDKEKLDRLDILLQQLPVKQREAFVMRHFQELTYKEIAEITGKSIGAIKANYFHAFKKIVEMVDEE